MLFTIAIPCYNGAHCVATAIQSALNQDYDAEYEILVVNNASTDNTRDIISQFYSSKIRVIDNNETVNLFANHNVCLKQAKGDYVVFCHSDDQLLPHALKVLDNIISYRLYPGKYIVWGRSMYRDFSYNLNTINYKQNNILTGEESVKCFISVPWGLAPSGVCYSREGILGIGGFCENMLSKITPHDWTILMNASLACFEFEQIDRLLLKRIAASTATDTLNEKYRLVEHQKALKLFLDSLSEDKRTYFINNEIESGKLEHYAYWKPLLSKKEKFKMFMRLLRSNPWSFLHLVRHFLK